MDALHLFASGVNLGDVANPLRTLTTYAELLQKENPLGSGLLEWHQRAFQGGHADMNILPQFRSQHNTYISQSPTPPQSCGISLACKCSQPNTSGRVCMVGGGM